MSEFLALNRKAEPARRATRTKHTQSFKVKQQQAAEKKRKRAETHAENSHQVRQHVSSMDGDAPVDLDADIKHVPVSSLSSTVNMILTTLLCQSQRVKALILSFFNKANSHPTRPHIKGSRYFVCKHADKNGRFPTHTITPGMRHSYSSEYPFKFIILPTLPCAYHLCSFGDISSEPCTAHAPALLSHESVPGSERVPHIA
jgi:hypothetical protein